MAKDSSNSGTSCWNWNGFDENNKIDTHPRQDKKVCKDALYVDPETGITIFKESGM